MWSQYFTSEVFFEIINSQTDGPGKESIGYLASSRGYKDIIATTSFYDFMNQNSKAVRFQLLKILNGKSYMQKYPSQGTREYYGGSL